MAAANFFITVWNLSLLHLFLNKMYKLSIITFFNIAIQAGLFVFLNGVIIGKVWLAAGLVLAWISGSIFFQVPNWLARKINV
ncbi:MAG: hypothetical protein K2X59_12040 [Sphingomonas sp.]|nr:hypothetical protein [Sphingomonas sp.]